jgi:hypothetical protein
MQHPIAQAALSLAVFLGLYGFYCHWEAGRAELAQAFRQRGRMGGPQGLQYRARCRWALLGSALLSASIFILSR